jgi:hypothetical protein
VALENALRQSDDGTHPSYSQLPQQSPILQVHSHTCVSLPQSNFCRDYLELFDALLIRKSFFPLLGLHRRNPLVESQQSGKERPGPPKSQYIKCSTVTGFVSGQFRYTGSTDAEGNDGALQYTESCTRRSWIWTSQCSLGSLSCRYCGALLGF